MGHSNTVEGKGGLQVLQCPKENEGVGWRVASHEHRDPFRGTTLAAFRDILRCDVHGGVWEGFAWKLGMSRREGRPPTAQEKEEIEGRTGMFGARVNFGGKTALYGRGKSESLCSTATEIKQKRRQDSRGHVEAPMLG